MKTVVLLALVGLTTAKPLECRKFYCLTKQPCAAPIPDCAKGYEQYARLESWMKIVLEDSFVIGMAPAVLSATEFEVNFGSRCSVIFRVQTPYEALPEDACLAANNVSDDHFKDPC